MTYSPQRAAPAAAGGPGRFLAPALWPLAAIAVIHRCLVRPSAGDTTDDFSTVFSAIWRFLDGERVYEQDYASIVPHYLYSPGGTLALAPLLGWSDDLDTVRWGFLAMQAAAIVAALVLLLRWAGVPWGHWLYPGTIAAAFVTETVSNTVAFTNVNGMILLAEVAFLILLHRRRALWAGLVIGLAITVKPVVAPLLFLPFVRRQFTAVAAGVAVPVAFNAVAWPLMTAPSEYLSLTVPYLGVVRDYANVSLAGQFEYFGVPGPWILLWRAIVALAVVVGLVLLLRWVDRDEVFWLATTSALLLTGVFLLGSLGQMYYSMLLFPLFATLARPLAGARDAWGEPARTVLLSPAVAAGLALCLWFTSFQTEALAAVSWWFDVGRGTIGWLLVAFGLVGCLVRWTVEEAARGIPAHPALPGVRSAP